MVSLLLQFIALIGLWNMRRWAVLVLVAITAFSIYTSLNNGFNLRVLLAVGLARALVLIPGILYWKSLTW